MTRKPTMTSHAIAAQPGERVLAAEEWRYLLDVVTAAVKVCEAHAMSVDVDRLNRNQALSRLAFHVNALRTQTCMLDEVECG